MLLLLLLMLLVIVLRMLMVIMAMAVKTANCVARPISNEVPCQHAIECNACLLYTSPSPRD
eukprot:7195535-Alexandrium_andersonii.AAC.1